MRNLSWWLAGLALATGIWDNGLLANGPGCPCIEELPGSHDVLRQIDAGSVLIRTDASGFLVEFSGKLQSAGSVDGPWVDIANAQSPYRVAGDAGVAYFRSLRSYEGGPLFGGISVVPMALVGTLQSHFDLAVAGVPDGFFPPKREKPYFDGVIELGGKSVPASLRVRGNSSLQECPFPKLKFKISKENRAGTPFEDAREIKVGTHCAEGGRGNIGRLRDERATYREAVAYEVMNALGFTGPRVRRAVIEFRDTSLDRGFENTGWKRIRAALLLEDADVLADRLGGHALDDLELAALTKANFGEQSVFDLKLLHALLGNWDYVLTTDGQGLWNTEVIRMADGSYLPVAGDFDLSSWVTERVLLNAPRDYFPELPDLERQMHYQLGQLRETVPEEIWQASRARFLGRHETLERLVHDAVVDELGRENMERHLKAMFGILGGR